MIQRLYVPSLVFLPAAGTARGQPHTGWVGLLKAGDVSAVPLWQTADTAVFRGLPVPYIPASFLCAILHIERFL